ncbi:hypothetical protein QQS21_012476 [Conoideocrella luteorostrata]|uniref:F-box domain-containing protein n=1 Tax=Conoideocrella luteorostrata TaxID=1105319 RepID=A0AAJ0CBE5_9HYPO|nr:hypothetical protein QQS21_012476 [Conoideocrella luteorostrata]
MNTIVPSAPPLHMAQESPMTSKAMFNVNRIYELPWDIMLVILNQLPPPDRVAFALTSRAFFLNVFPNGKAPSLGQNTILLLLRLERDDPAQTVCFKRNRLCAVQDHSVCKELPLPDRSMIFELNNKNWFGWFISADNDTKEKRFKERYPAWRPEMKWPAITFEEAHSIMHQHLHGSQLELSLKSLEYNFSFVRYIDVGEYSHFPLGSQTQNPSTMLTVPWTFKHSAEAKIIDDDLYIARFHTVIGPPTPRKKMMGLLHEMALPICKHTSFYRSRTSSDMLKSQHRVIPELASPKRSRNLSFKRSRTCAVCSTDYSFEIREGKCKGWKIQLATYHRLGRCESPYDSTWQRHTGNWVMVSLKGDETPDPKKRLFGWHPGQRATRWWERTPRGELRRRHYYFRDYISFTGRASKTVWFPSMYSEVDNAYTFSDSDPFEDSHRFYFDSDPMSILFG